MTTTIEPTEDQRMAAVAHALGTPMPDYAEHWVKTGENVRTERGFTISAGPVALARLIAEREHKLRKDNDRAWQDINNARGEAHLAEVETRRVQADLDAARARIAELEVYADTAMRNRDAHAAARDELEEREAAHLAHIKALRRDGTALLNCEHNNMREMRDQFVSTLIATAHYDVESERIAHAIVERLTGVKR